MRLRFAAWPRPMTLNRGAEFADLVKDAHCAVTVDAGAMERPYQGIVEISADSLAASLENYFARSVQVPSHLALVTAGDYCGGIILQQMPGESAATDDDWRRLGFMIATLRPEDLSDGATPELLHKLFAEDDLRVFSRRSLRFRCRCSQLKVEEALRMLGESETRDVLAELGEVIVKCEYCGTLSLIQRRAEVPGSARRDPVALTVVVQRSSSSAQVTA